jgi:Tfp pilus assembly protein PilV
VEAVMTMSLMSIGLLGLSASSLIVTRAAKGADSSSAATSLTVKTLEAVRSMPLDANPGHRPGTYTIGNYYPNGNQGGPIGVTYTVSGLDTPRMGLKTVNVTAAWTDAKGNHSLVQSAFIRCSTIPCRIY